MVLDHEAANRKYNLYESTKIKRIEFVHYYGYKISIRSTRNHCKLKDHFIPSTFQLLLLIVLFLIVSFKDIESISKCLDLIFGLRRRFKSTQTNKQSTINNCNYALLCTFFSLEKLIKFQLYCDAVCLSSEVVELKVKAKMTFIFNISIQ